MSVGIVAALPGEARSLARLRARGTAVLADGAQLRLSGLGAERATAAARALVAEGVDRLISWGSAAALVPALHPGDLLLPREIIASDGRRLHSDDAWRESLTDALPGGLRIRHGALVQATGVLVNVASKQVLHECSHAVAADMESAAIAAVAAEFGLPFIAIRAIADDSTMILPPAANAAVDADGALKPLSMLRALAGRPRTMHAQLRALKQLAVAFKAAQNTLGVVALEFVDTQRAA
ncbi:phosphorylase family protein [Salinisphaera aquimarina]|uniref:Purine phosphorylase n=1 Tax=Salinisphaera aquimarina TaxID=2094031 RepID=A0ABV7ETS1_9GAMM